jgi:hypothetical protein
LLTVIVTLAAPASALAAVQLTSATLTPSTTQAGAHPDVTVDLAFDVSAGDDVKSVGVVLPQGLVGDPNVADRCRPANFTADTCAATTKVGTTTAAAVVTVIPGILEIPQDVPGDVYNLQPRAGEAARLGVVLRPSAAGAVALPKVFLQSAVTVGPDTGFGLKTVFDELPRESGGLDIQVTAMKLVLNSKAARGSFLTNPTGCGQATTTATISSYEEPTAPKSATSSFTPTGCDKLPFAPQLTGAVGGTGLTDNGKSPTLTAIISPGGAGESNVKRAEVTLPAIVGPNFAALGRACPRPAFDAGSCPATSRIGSAAASSPLLATPLTGPVTLVDDSPLPSLAVQFGPPVPLTLFGAVGIEGSSLKNTFDGIPDLPLSRFELAIDGGEGGLLANSTNLCRLTAPAAARGVLTGHSGATSTLNATFEVRGCPPGPSTVVGGKEGKPSAALSLRYKRGLGTLRARFRSGKGGSALKRARLALPKGFYKRPGARKRLRVTAGKRRLGRKQVRLRGRTLDVRLRRAARTVTVRWRAIRPGRKLARRLPRRPRLTFVARVTPAGGKSARLRLTVRPAVARR